jgi:hypothetical protein
MLIIFQYREKLIAINDALNNLKKEFSSLTTVCDEATYMRLENSIIIYELKLKKFKEDYENKSSLDRVTDYHQFEISQDKKMEWSRQKPQYMTINESNKNLLMGFDNKENNSNDVYFRNDNYYDNNSYYQENYQQISNNQRPKTCDKCIETVNEIGTQTVDDEEMFYIRNNINNTFSSTSIENHQKINSNLIHRKKPTNGNNGNLSKLRNRANRTNSNSNKLENCGKKLLLEAYLKDNTNNKSLNNETTTSENETYASEQNVFRIETTTTTTTRESGVGTFNEEDIDEIPFTDDYMKEKSSKHYKYHKNDLKKTDITEKEKISPALSTTTSIGNILGTKLPKSDEIVDDKKTSVDSIKILKENNLNSQASTSNPISNRYFTKLLKFLFMFSIFFLILFFFVYRFLFNPVCCDS